MSKSHKALGDSRQNLSSAAPAPHLDIPCQSPYSPSRFCRLFHAILVSLTCVSSKDSNEVSETSQFIPSASFSESENRPGNPLLQRDILNPPPTPIVAITLPDYRLQPAVTRYLEPREGSGGSPPRKTPEGMRGKRSRPGGHVEHDRCHLTAPSP